MLHYDHIECGFTAALRLRVGFEGRNNEDLLILAFTTFDITCAKYLSRCMCLSCIRDSSIKSYMGNLYMHTLQSRTRIIYLSAPFVDMPST